MFKSAKSSDSSTLTVQQAQSRLHSSLACRAAPPTRRGRRSTSDSHNTQLFYSAAQEVRRGRPAEGCSGDWRSLCSADEGVSYKLRNPTSIRM
ncbi:hypothetical protein Y032_0286g1400 [Ancylostoma ceylanicum]|uniref:Uncharacterized protein n=1 Tax=Ancylostoma ceylanicum TaxID=53326 RepID=A0A016S6W6_9BILA|nr:hypothetical protein Y032_0286g1400 [Ancylostoma ceylanicum]